MIKTSLACGLQTCLGQQWTKDVYSDFTVVVEDQEFKCHRFILGACSKFFNGLLRSEMIESMEHKVVLQNMSKETFTVILNNFYKGKFDGLKEENIIQVWHATHFLDIAYLLKECEDFIMENMTLSNYEDFHHHAKMLNSENVVQFTKTFLTNKFDFVWKSKLFLQISFSDVHLIIDDHYLKVKSEDNVVDAILEWVAHQENKDISSGSETKKKHYVCLYNAQCAVNETLKDKSVEENDIPQMGIIDNSVIKLWNNPERTHQMNEKAGPSYNNQTLVSTVAESSLNKDQELIELLKAARLCLASRKCLEKLMDNPKITSNREALKIVHASLLYHSKGKSYSNNCIVRYRECSGLSNVMAFVSDGDIRVYSLQRECFYTLYSNREGYPDLSDTHCIAAINSKLYFDTCERTGSYSHSFQSFDPENYDWEDVAMAKVPFLGILLSQHDTITYINVRDSPDKIVVEPNNSFCLINDYLDARFATIFNDDILIFCTTNNINSVYRYNWMTRKETTLHSITGTYTDMCSFQKDQNHYILQKDGLLWLVEEDSSDNIIFTRMAELWNEELPLKGAVLYGDMLFVFYSETSSTYSSVESQFRISVVKTIPTIGSMSIRFIDVDSQTPVIPMTISTGCLR